jgi:phage terminase large subunit
MKKRSKAKNKCLRRYQNNPLGFIKDALGVKQLTKEQKEIVISVWENKYTGVKAAHNVGKTFIEACIVLSYLMLYANSIVITTAPTARQVRDLLWAEINNLYACITIPFVGEIKMMGFTVGPKWFASGIATETGKEEQSAVKFQGYHSGRILVVLDEAVGIHPSIWEAVDGIASSENSKVLAVGNPSTMNCSFKKHLDGNQWRVFYISALNHPNVRKKKEIIPGAVSYSWVKDKVEKWCKSTPKPAVSQKKNNEHIFKFERKYYKPNSLFLWKVLGEFPDESPDVLIPLYKIQQAIERGQERSADTANMPASLPNICHLSIDVARFGSDNSVFALNKNNHFSLFPYYHLDTAKLTGEAVNLIKIHKPTKVSVDCDGIGAGVFDNLNEAKNQGIFDAELYEIHGGANPLQLGQTEDYLNLRAQMYWLFKNDIDLISLDPHDELEEGLSSIKHYFNSKGKIQIESKDEIKKRLGRSPDMEDALVYCNFLKYVDSNTCGEFDYCEPAEKHESVTEKIGI